MQRNCFGFLCRRSHQEFFFEKDVLHLRSKYLKNRNEGISFSSFSYLLKMNPSQKYFKDFDNRTTILQSIFLFVCLFFWQNITFHKTPLSCYFFYMTINSFKKTATFLKINTVARQTFKWKVGWRSGFWGCIIDAWLMFVARQNQ